MNVIVSNKQKRILDNANIDAIKDLNGFFDVNEVINNVKNYFFSKMIIDATSIVNFAHPEVLKKLVDGIGAEKLMILLPPKPEPPRKFLELLTSLGIREFSTNINDIVALLQVSNNINDVKSVMDNNMVFNNKANNKYILGIKNITKHAGTTSLIYMLKQVLTNKYHKKVLAIEFGTNDFQYFKSKDMTSTNANNLDDINKTLKNNNYDIVLVDLNNASINLEFSCDEVLYLIEPSIIKVNTLMQSNNRIFYDLNGKKIVLNKSLLSHDDVQIFSKEANTQFYFVLPPVNDRVENEVIELLLKQLEIVA